ncbi:MAG: hypothetical protein KF901_24785 [Myxococcales bacterium]|nr:hypothetical protein [Myxococcales bacterium]
MRLRSSRFRPVSPWVLLLTFASVSVAMAQTPEGPGADEVDPTEHDAADEPREPAWEPLPESAPVEEEEEDEEPDEEALYLPHTTRVRPPLEVLPGFYPRSTGIFEDRGLWIGTPDRRFVLRAGGFVHLDSRVWAADGEPAQATLFWRRARFGAEATLFGEIDLRVLYDVVISPYVPYDLHIDWRRTPGFNLRFGKFKSVFGLERRNRAYSILFNERTFPTIISPNRDLGLFIYGQTVDGFFSYEASIAAGAADGEVLDQFRGPPEVAGRIYVMPFRLTDRYPALHHLGFGFSMTQGVEHGSVDAPHLGGVRTTGRRRVFGYRDDGTLDGTAYSDGYRHRYSAQVHWRHERYQAFFEYVWSAQRITLGETSQQLARQAWQLYGSVSLTDEENAFFGVKPKRPFAPAQGQWGGATLSARYGEYRSDRRAFPIFADPDASVRSAHATALSLQWHLNVLLELQFDVEYVWFRGGAPGGANAPGEIIGMIRTEARY